MSYLFISSSQGISGSTASKFQVSLPREVRGRAPRLINISIDNTLVTQKQIGIYIQELCPATIAQISPAQFIVPLTTVNSTDVIFNEGMYSQTIPFDHSFSTLTVQLYTTAGAIITTQSNHWTMLFEICN